MARRTIRRAEVTVLVSGGIDSTACVSFYREQGASVAGLFVDYGQASNLRERQATESVAQYFGIDVQYISFSGVGSKPAGLIMGRNALLLFMALMETHPPSQVALGIHAGTDYYDCSPRFVDAAQHLFDAYSQGTVQIAAPFLRWRKRDVWDYCTQARVPVHLTYSCELGLDQPCGKCQSCRDLEQLHARA